MYIFAKEMFFDANALGNKNTREKSPIRLLKSPAFITSGIYAIVLPENPNELCDKLK